MYDGMNKENSIRTIKEELLGIQASDIALIVNLLNKLAQIEYDNYMKLNQ